MLQYLLLAAGSFLAAFISGAAGFGGSLLLLPLVVVILCLALRRVQALRFRLRWKQAMASFAVLLALLLSVEVFTLVKV